MLKKDKKPFETITLTQGYETMVDPIDKQRFEDRQWYAVKHGKYIRAVSYDNEGNTVYLHREIMDAPINQLVDHANGDTLDNRKCNLRICGAAENAQNRKPLSGKTSKYKGVRKIEDGKFRAEIRPSTGYIHLGIFNNEKEAALAYNYAAKEHYGHFAWLNDVNV